MSSLDRQWYLDVNHWARSTAWLHGFMHAYALWAGVVVLAVLVVFGWWRARRDGARAVALSLWAAIGTVVALGLNQPLSHLVGRVRPYDVMRGVEVLVPRANDFTFPSDHATVAGAVIVGLFLAGRKLLGIAAVILGFLLAFARVYVGAHYPADVVAGLLFGGFVVAVLSPLARRILQPIVELLERGPLRFLVSSSAAGGGGSGSRRSGSTPRHLKVPTGA